MAPSRLSSDETIPEDSSFPEPPLEVQEPSHNFAPNGFGFQSSLDGPLPNEKYDAQNTQQVALPASYPNTFSNILQYPLTIPQQPPPLYNQSEVHSIDPSLLSLPGLSKPEFDRKGHIGQDSVFRDQILSRNYFVFDLSESLVYLESMYAHAYNAVFIYINYMRPDAPLIKIRALYVNLVVKEMKTSSTDDIPFDNRLKKLFSKLLQVLDFDLKKIPCLCEKLVSIHDRRIMDIQSLEGELDLQPLLDHLHLLGKKIVFICKLKGKSSGATFRSYADLLISKTIDGLHMSTPCMLSRVPLYTSRLPRVDCFGYIGDVLQRSTTIPDINEGTVFRNAILDLQCRQDDIVFMSYNSRHTKALTLHGSFTPNSVPFPMQL
ncbi:hypothetical protein NHQ30_003330 [Ciborinia camelliae]|nr:hypothetical protein NHQ30_003330 [Ciborinia camelliae]